MSEYGTPPPLPSRGPGHPEAAGDFAEAQVSSAKAKQFAILAAVIGLPLSLILGLIQARAGS